MLRNRPLATLIVACSLAAAAQAAPVWSETFADDTVGNAPQQNYAVATGNDWSVGTGVGTAQTVQSVGGGNAYSGSDTSTTVSSSSFVNFNRFASFATTDPTQGRFTATFDLRVDSFASTSNVSTFRVSILDNYNNGAARARGMTVGLGYVNLDGVAGNELFLFAGATDDVLASASTVSPLAANAVGYNGTSFAPDFDFGQFVNATPDANDTDDEFYRFALTFTGGSGVVEGTATRLSNGASTSFTRTLPGGATYDFRGGALAGAAPTDTLSIILPQSGTGQLYVDNLNFDASAVPEPATLGAVALGALALLGRRRGSIRPR